MSESQFKPAWWLPNPHLQTMWPVICRTGIKDLPLLRERLELPDGDFIDLDWCGKQQSGSLVLILHGFEGSIESHYSKGMLQSICRHGWRGVFMHFRGCSGEPNRLPRGYHSGDTADLAFVVSTLLNREPKTDIAAVGYSLGGNVLLKWLGETGNQNPLSAATAISVPFELHKAAKRIQQGFSRFYEWYLVKCARQRLLQKFQQMPVPAPINISLLSKVNDVQELDGKYTVPVHGFSSVDEYYTVSSSRQYLRSIQIPTLLVHSKDDPFMSEDVIPEQSELSEHITLEVTEAGGHVGFVSGKFPWRPEYWLEERVPEFLKYYL
ncbi:MAG: hydrolase [Gammaproteobacteria bacterium]|nr:hydrolase [Gammaproteobacteria bacterium]MCW5584114.1 hydrolase [Gammaproteobacteria bacterium]